MLLEFTRNVKYCSNVAQSAKNCVRVLKMQNSAPDSKKCSKGAQRNRERPSGSTGSPSAKYEHRRTSALLRNIRNIRICMGKKPIVSVTYENERISIKNKTFIFLVCT